MAEAGPEIVVEDTEGHQPVIVLHRVAEVVAMEEEEAAAVEMKRSHCLFEI